MTLRVTKIRVPKASGGPRPSSTAPRLNTDPSRVPPPSYTSDPTYQAQTGAVNRSATSTVAGLLGERDRGLQDLGFTYSGTEDTPAVTFDPTNVFSRAALLQRTYRQAQAGNANSYAARGQFNSGAYARQVRNTAFNQQADETRLSSQALDFAGRSLAAVRAAQNGASERVVTELAPAAIDRMAANYTAPAFGKPVGNAPAPLVRNGYLYRPAADGSGRMLRIRKATRAEAIRAAGQ